MVCTNTGANVPEMENPKVKTYPELRSSWKGDNSAELSGTGTLGASSHPSCLKRNWHL